MVVHRLPKDQSDYQLCTKIQEYFHIRKLILDNSLPDISPDYQIIQLGSPADNQNIWIYGVISAPAV